MTITGWIVCIMFSAMAGIGAWGLWAITDKLALSIIAGIVAVVLIFGIGFWYCNNTADGKRAMTDQYANLSNGLERTVTVYTADGKVLAQYEGRIDIDQNDGGYVKFDFNGKRYIYYNCFVESIADLR